MVSNSPLAFAKGNVDLAAYLYALSTARQLPSSETISELVQCNSLVNQGRENMPDGSMNVIPNLIAKPQLYGFQHYIRTIISEKGDSADAIVAYSSFASAGACRENSLNVTVIHSQKTQADNPVYRIRNKIEDHNWVETNNVVMDSWAYGPAILKADSVFAAKEGSVKELWDKEEGRRGLEYGKALLAQLNSDDKER